MKNLESKISTFNNWEQPCTFYEFICSDKSIKPEEIELFIEIWKKASDYELWNSCDLILGCKATQKFIVDNYNLTEESVAKIVRAISYEWK